MPGRMAGYARGRNALRACVLHYTVGIDSAGIGKRGFFNWLVRRNGEVVQFAPADALTWHAGEWNPDGPGIELEYLERVDGPKPANIVTPQQTASAGKLIRWLHTTTAIPLTFYDGPPRIRRGYRGWLTHRSLVQAQPHTDFITAAQWSAMIGGGPAAAPTARR